MYSVHMKILAKILLHFIFSLVFLLALLLGTLIFRLLDQNFLFEALEEHQVYENLPTALADSLINDHNLTEEEKMFFPLVIEKISPELLQRTVESNLAQVFAFLRGESSDMVFTLSVAELGIPEMTEDIEWIFSKEAPTDLQEKIQPFYGAIPKLKEAAWTLVGVLLALLILYAHFSRPKVLNGIAVLLSPVGLVHLLLGSFGFILLSQIPLPEAGTREPAEILMDQLMRALIPGISSFFLTIGIPLFLFVLITQIYDRLSSIKPK